MPTSPESLRALEIIRAFATEQGVDVEEGTRPGEVVLTLPGENKLRTSCSLIAGGRALSLSAFVIRRPDENHVAVYRFLLQRNLALPGLAYAIDDSGDVYVTGQVPIGVVDEEYLDQLLGVVLAATDEVFNELLVLGFISSMRKEWSWRVSREESLANLEPFREILAKDEEERARVSAHEPGVGEDEVDDEAGPTSPSAEAARPDGPPERTEN